MKSIILTILLLCNFIIVAQEKFTLSGNIKDAENGEDLIGVNVIITNLSGVGTTSNVYGFYSITLPKGKYTVKYQYIGYDDYSVNIDLSKNIQLNVELKPSALQLQAFEVQAEAENENIKSTQMSVDKIDIKEIETIPVLFGEKDILKTIQLLPGVKSAGEGNSGFSVRGGNIDQNLILIDEAPVYNASHLLGFFSVFNSDALKDVKLYKGGIPAEYGGRLSSVMDIKMKDGNAKQFSATGGIGLIASRLTIEAPIVKDKGSFLLSGRRTYADLFLKFSNDTNQQNSQLYFYDFNAKANYQINDKNRIYLSGYFGRDKLGLANSFGFDWGNITATLRWNHIFNDKLFSNTSFIFSNYNYSVNISSANFSINSAIEDLNLKQDFNWYANESNSVKFGFNSIYHTFKPGKLDADEDSPISTIEIPKRYSLENAVYIANEQKVNGLLSLNYGLRYSNFTQFGPGDIFSYNELGEVTDTTVYKKGEPVVTYHGLAPRIAATYSLSEDASIKASYTRTYQYLHLLSNSATSTPTDVWMPSSNNIKPEIADQFALGYFKNLAKNKFTFSVETYYKPMQNTIDYRTGASITLNPTAEGELLYGKARAYGIEFYLKKNKGNFTGWISYTLARSERKFEQINNNSWFPSRYDRTHDVSIVLMYNLNERIDFSASWVYYTGNAVTFPSGKYTINDQIINLYTERNGYRFPDYHRLDIGVNIKNKPYKEIKNPETGETEKIKKRFESAWNISVYNAYGRENAYIIEFRQSDDNPNKSVAVQTALFKFIPSVTYNFKF
jgi:hypothetical protein